MQPKLPSRNEASHAELSWHIAAWMEPQLNASERAQLALARRAALVELYEAATATALPTHAALTLGYPSPALEHSTLNQLRDTFAIA